MQTETNRLTSCKSAQMSIQNQPTDIDLLDVLAQIISFFKRHILYLIVAAFFGAAVGYGIYQYKDKEYKSSLVAMTHSLEDGRVIELFDDLNQLIMDNDYPRLAKMLNMPLERAKLVNDFEVTSFYDLEKKTKKLNDDKMELRPSTTVKITVNIKDTSVLRDLQVGISQYVSSNEYGLEVNNIHRANFRAQIQELERRIKEADSLNKITIIKLKSGGGNLIFGNELAASQALIAELEQKRNGMIQELALVKDFAIIKPFTVFKKARWPKLSVALGVGMSISVVSTILGILIFGRKRLA